MATCNHTNVTDRPRYAIDDPPGHWLCLDCADTFPLIGDTDQWKPTVCACEHAGPAPCGPCEERGHTQNARNR